MRRGLLVIVLASLSLAGVSDVRGDADCAKCKARPAEWSWKANGYALAADAAAGMKLAKERATIDACDTAAKHLTGRKIACPAGCAEGAIEERCEPDKKPKCTSGTYDSDKGMWKFVCRKVHQHMRTEDPCTDEHAKTTPGFGMCDVNVKAHKSRVCGDPKCP
jgi:hypothetical protein